MVYTELQPRELEKNSRLPEEIAMPKLIEEDEFPNCDIKDFSNSQQEIIEDVEKRKKMYQIHSLLNILKERMDTDYSKIRQKYENLQLDYDSNDSTIIYNSIMNIMKTVDNKLSLEQLEKVFSILYHSRKDMQDSLETLNSELEMEFCEAVGAKIEDLMMDNDILEKIFGKDKLHSVMIESIKKQIEERKNRTTKKYTNMIDIFKDVLSYVEENGMSENLKMFLSNYDISNATEEEKNCIIKLLIIQQKKKKQKFIIRYHY